MKRILYLISMLLVAVFAQGQINCRFTHYSSEDGLSQNTIMSILQDKKGNMWFSTWDGINKFDGYTFKVYKPRPTNHIDWINNRADYMQEDKYGYIYLKTYDEQVYRLDPRTEAMERIPAVHAGEDIPSITDLRVLPDGAVWLLTDGKGALRITTDSLTGQIGSQRFAGRSELFPPAHVFDVFEDAEGREWLLTDNGLGMLEPAQENPVFYFVETDRDDASKEQPFYVGVECDGEIFFGSNNGRVWRYQKQDGKFQLLKLSTAARVVDICNLRPSELLIATSTDGFFVYNVQTESLTHYAASRLPAAPLVSAYVDKSGEVWFEQHLTGIVAHFNPLSQQIKTEHVKVEASAGYPSHPNFHIHEDVYGTLWVHPYGGGFSYFDRKANCLRPFFNSTDDEANWHFSNKIHAAYSDRQGNLWLSTHSKGLEKITYRPAQFCLITPVPSSYETLANEARAICEDREGNLWVGLKDGKLRVYDRQMHPKGYLTEQGRIAHSGTPLRGTTYFLFIDSRGTLWIATKGDGLVKAEPVGGHYRLTRYTYDEDNIYSLSDNNVYAVYEDSRHRLWVATFGGGINYLMRDDDGREIFVSHRNHLKGYPIEHCHKARFITGDGKGNLWIGTTQGALQVAEDFATPEDAVFHCYRRNPDDPSSLSNNDVHWILPTNAGRLYLATFGGGLNELESIGEDGRAVFKSYSVADGLPSDVLLAIREDSRGNLWMSTENGVCKFVPSTGQCESYGDSFFPWRLRFSEAASAYTSLHSMMFGTNSGVLSFCPDSVHKSSFVPPLVLSRLLLANKPVTPGGHSVLQQSLDDTRGLTLSHRDNIVSIQYAALDYSGPDDIQYAYILEGFEKEWHYVGSQRMATYTNLPQGEYTFKVRSTNADGVWTDNVRRLEVEVLPSFWETPFAYFLYVLIFVLIIVSAVYILFMIYRLKHRVSMEQQLTDMKLRFFTDISHELRTPLTLIAGPVDHVLQNAALQPDVREQLQVVQRNTTRMLHLVNQILDFRKIQNRKMKMRVQRLEVVGFIRRLMTNFESLAAERHIDFLFQTEAEEIYLYVDADKFEKILFNLLSNAFKYTPAGKMITVFLRENENTVVVGVEDQGIGIPENRRKSIFLRFENLVDRNLFGQSSTGIGLSLVKELVELHKATISVDSKVGVGSRFQVEFLKGKEHYDDTVEILQDDATIETNDSVPLAVPSGEEAKPEKAPADTASAGKEMMLIVEDNAELRAFLCSIFAGDYRIVEAEDGQQGCEKALSLLPDIIVSDIMMPRKDGITLTRELRADMTTSHIPIVLLTAKSSDESQLEGMECGADGYITKPFSATYLKARVRNLLARRRQWQESFRTQLMSAVPPSPSDVTEEVEPVASEQPEQPVSAELSPNDRKFMDRLMEQMEKQLDNGDLLVEDLVRELAVSRSVFFKKLKTLTGLSPIEFIREVRIKRAAQYIASGEYSMSQIAYMVGINDPRYFSKSFKQLMGMTPTEYRDSLGKH